jgi:hypothetical protein
MIRGDWRFANSAYVDLVVTPAKGVVMQYRSVAGGVSAQIGTLPGVAPGWVRLTRSVNTFTGEWSTDGVTWKLVGTQTVNLPLDAFAGMAVTSHDTSHSATASFDDMRIQQ